MRFIWLALTPFLDSPMMYTAINHFVSGSLES